MPKISVCIPTYNRADLLRQSIDSVLAQDSDDWELLISDNASTDGTSSLLATYHDPRIRTVRQEQNVGMFKNFNAALAQASGTYVKMLMDDDALLPDCLRRQSEILDGHPNVNLVCSDYGVIDATGKPLVNIYYHPNTFRVFQQSQNEPGADFILAYLLGKRTVGLPSAVMFRLDVAVKIGNFDDQIGNPLDADLWLRLCQHGDFFYLDEKLLLMRSHDNWSKEFTAGSLGYRDVYNITQKHFRLNANHPLFKKNKNRIFQRLITFILPYFTRASAADRASIRSDLAKLPLTSTQRLALQTRLNLILLLHLGK